MTNWYEYAGMTFVYSVIALFALFILWLLFGRFERACYDKPKANKANAHDLNVAFKGKRCDNCRYSEVSTVYPELACPVIGRNVEAHHHCDEWI